MVQAARVETIADYDPMVYDIMREAANRLRGAFVDAARRADDPTERARLTAAQLAVWQEAQGVDSYDRAAVEAKTAEFRSRLTALRDAA